jgi:protein-tyrosine phosphatase
MPASMSARIRSGGSVAGPRVQTIFARRVTTETVARFARHPEPDWHDRQVPAALRVAMVCSGNICRSPMAETVLRTKLAAAGIDGVVVDSFGIGPWHVGQPADPRAVAALRARGYDIAHVARVIDAEDVGARDLIVAMEDEHVRAVRRLARGLPEPPEIRLLSSFVEDWPGADNGVPDPYYGGPAEYAHALDLIERGADGIVAELGRG